MKKKLIAFIIVGVIIIGFIIFISHKTKDNDILALYGNIEIRQADLSFQVSGQIEKLLKEEGDTVKKGELIAFLDAKDYEANYQKALANVQRTVALKNEASNKYNRNKSLGKAGAVSYQEVETLFNNKNLSVAEYNIAEAEKTFTKNQLDYTKLYAPDDGIIMVRIQEEGTTVAKGQPVYTMAKTKPVWVRAYINETDLGNIKYGQKVDVYTDTKNPQTGIKRQYEGQIGYISPVAEFTPKTVQSTDIRTDLVYRIRVYIFDTDEYLRQGMPVTINVNLRNGK